MDIHYLDNAATTQVYSQAAQKAFDAMTQDYGNPSSVHSMGLRAEELLDEARQALSQALGCMKNELYFTSGGTEANNWALFGAFEAMRRRGNHVITTCVEHSSVLNSVKRLEQMGARVTYLPVGAHGDFDMDAFKAACCEDTALVSVMLVNNETGAVFPVQEISAHLKRIQSHALVHTDAVQGLLKLPFTAPGLGADLVSVSGHKIHGPKGAGALYIKKGLNLPIFIRGGGQERTMRSGTEPVPAIAAFGEACKLGFAKSAQDQDTLRTLYAYALEKISADVRDVQFIIPGFASAHILNISLPGIPSQVLVRFLEARGVFVSAGSACSRGKRSHVLDALHLDPKRIDSSIRISFSHQNTCGDIDALCAGLIQARLELAPRVSG